MVDDTAEDISAEDKVDDEATEVDADKFSGEEMIVDEEFGSIADDCD